MPEREQMASLARRAFARRALLRSGFLAAWLLPQAAMPVTAACPDGESVFTPDFSNGPVVFDFEDGLQGWTVRDGAERIETDLLGGSFAVFGDGRDAEVQGPIIGGMIFLASLVSPALARCIDITHVSALQIDRFVTAENAEGRRDPTLSVVGLVEGIFIGAVQPFESADPEVDPGLLRADLSDLDGEFLVAIAWTSSDLADPTTGASFVDDVTLIPAPEPGSTPAYAGALAALDLLRRRTSRHAALRR